MARATLWSELEKTTPERAEKPENTDLAGNDANTTAHPASRFFEKIQTAILPASHPCIAV